MIELTLPYPPSANRLWRAVKGRNIESREYRAWKTEAMRATRDSGHRGAVTGPFTITIAADRPDRRARDLDNIIKPTLDALKPVKVRTIIGMVEKIPGVIRDDSDVREIRALWSDRLPGKGAAVHVRVEAVS